MALRLAPLCFPIFKPVENNIKILETLLGESLEDLVFSRQEKRTLKKSPALKTISSTQRDWLLSRARDLAMSRLPEKPEIVMAWFYEAVKALKPKESPPMEASEAYFSPGTACRSAIIRQLHKARKHIDICVFTISDNQIRDEIASMHQLGKRIRIISDNDKSADMGSDIDFLRRLGIPLILDNTEVHMHHKFALFDQERLLSGSYNWTRSAAERNYENLVLSTEANLVRSFQQEFERLWKKLH